MVSAPSSGTPLDPASDLAGAFNAHPTRGESGASKNSRLPRQVLREAASHPFPPGKDPNPRFFDLAGSWITGCTRASRRWSELIAGDEVLATAILNRLLHRAHVLNIKGEAPRHRPKSTRS